MAEAKTLGPNATYLGEHEGDTTTVTYQGINFVPGESINVEERAGPGARAILAKLAGNRFFRVDGGQKHPTAPAAAPPQEPPVSYQAPKEPTLERTAAPAAAKRRST